MSWFPSKQKGGTPLEVCTWAGGTDEQIAAMLEAHYAGEIDIHDYWVIGDERVVSLSAMPATGVSESHVAQDVTLVLSEAGGKTLSDGITECAFQFDQKDCLIEKGEMSSSSSGKAKWSDSIRRTWCNSIYKEAFPVTLQPIFKIFKNSTIEAGRSTPVEVLDTFALRSRPEVAGPDSQIEWYKTSSNRIKQLNNSDSVWWTRTYGGALYNYTFYVVTESGNTNINKTYTELHGIAPFGCI